MLAAKRWQLAPTSIQTDPLGGQIRSFEMSSTSKPQKRWMASVLKTAANDMPTLPFQRGQRKTTAQRSAEARFQPRGLRSA
jgi:hypothetical protein